MTFRSQLSLTGREPYFAGHFDNNPILSGVSQIDIVADILSKHLNKYFTVVSVANTKFRRQIIPPAIVSIELNLVDDICDFTICTDNDMATSGRIKIKVKQDETSMKNLCVETSRIMNEVNGL